MAGITAAEENPKTLGYDAQHCHIDFGQTAEAIVIEALQKNRYDCISMGSGSLSRAKQSHSLEKLINVIHVHASHR